MWMQRTYNSGGVIEKTRFWVRAKGTPRRPRKAPSNERQQERNAKSAVRKLARIINTNFAEGAFCKLGWDAEAYAQLEASCDGDRAAMVAAARHEAKLFLLRLRRFYKKQGTEPKVVIVVSDKDHRGRPGRIHLHMVVNMGSYAEITALWGKNGRGIGWEELYHEQDRTPLAEYLLKQAARVGNGAQYIVTRNMDLPTVTEEFVESNAEIRLPAGARELERSEYRPDSAQYVRYIRRKKNEHARPKGGGKGEIK